ncbi:MAG: histidine phosphatase family protein [Myxococcales bacterium]|nr:histidine phosphatase family protein [Myxococcales bacterium]
MRAALDIYLLRHGLTDANATGTIQGHQPTPLNAEGRRQAAQLAARFGPGGITVDALVSSDLRRARETAEVVASRAGVPLTLDAAWRERGLGSWEGQRVGELGIWQAATSTEDPPGAETAAAFAARVRAALATLPERFEAARAIGVVTHGGAIRTLLRMLAAAELPSEGPVPLVAMVANCSILHLVLHAERRRFQVLTVNDVAHLGVASSADVG